MSVVHYRVPIRVLSELDTQERKERLMAKPRGLSTMFSPLASYEFDNPVSEDVDITGNGRSLTSTTSADGTIDYKASRLGGLILPKDRESSDAAFRITGALTVVMWVRILNLPIATSVNLFEQWVDTPVFSTHNKLYALAYSTSTGLFTYSDHNESLSTVDTMEFTHGNWAFVALRRSSIGVVTTNVGTYKETLGTLAGLPTDGSATDFRIPATVLAATSSIQVYNTELTDAQVNQLFNISSGSITYTYETSL